MLLRQFFCLSVGLLLSLPQAFAEDIQAAQENAPVLAAMGMQDQRATVA